MANKEKSTARDVFFYLLMIVTLYVGVVSFLTLLFQFTNLWFPDPLDYFSASYESIRFSTAALFVVWPVFIFMSWAIERDMKKDAKKREIWVRRWLLYLTLFIAAITIIVDLITVINGFLGGELSVRFYLKVLFVLLVAAAVFGYYLRSLKHGADNSKLPLVSAWVSSFFAVIVIIAAIFAVGTPATQRDLRFDEQRVNNLEQLQSNILEYWNQKNVLPNNLEELTTGINLIEQPLDPETNEPFAYLILGDLSFQLCATFSLPSDERSGAGRISYFGGKTQNWDHQAGKTCFDRTIDPDFFKDNLVPRPIIQ